MTIVGATPTLEIDRLREQGMPENEILAILSARDPRIVRRHLELHRERLEERVIEERNAVDLVEDALASRMRWS